ncbi:MAG: hypothetical protein NT016_02990 [Candidatus Aenigmarchaeota archaeon]|nr:hypothetical protein [Candidatus Aenigmarchaeota archaeon]
MKKLAYNAGGAVKETADRTVLEILYDFDHGWVGADQASACARAYLLRKDAGWTDERMLENLDVYAAVVDHVYSKKSSAEQLYAFSRNFILRLLMPLKSILKKYTARLE